MAPSTKNSSKSTASVAKHPVEDIDNADSAQPPAKRSRRSAPVASREGTGSTLDEGMAPSDTDGAPTRDLSGQENADQSSRTHDGGGEATGVSEGKNIGNSVNGVSGHTAHGEPTDGPDNNAGSHKDEEVVGGAGSGGAAASHTQQADTMHDPRVVFERRRWFSNDLMKRIPPMLTYAMPGDNMYSLSTVSLDDLDWGHSASSSGKLCLNGGSVPITMWVIGVIETLWVFNRDGNPEERITIGVTPLTDHAMGVARNILASKSRPPAGISSMLTHVSASRWMSVRISGERASQVLEFDKVYDAKARYGAKNTMTQIPVERLKKGDLVLMEVQVSRYNSAPKPSGSSKFKGKNLKPTEFVQWKATFDLMTVSLLETGPNVIQDAEEVPSISDATFSM